MVEAPFLGFDRPMPRREQILLLADELRNRFDPRNIDRITQEYQILLVRKAGSSSGAAGFAHVEYRQRPEFIESLARPGEFLPVWESQSSERFTSIVINANSSIPEAEIFWHEFYHLYYSPESIQGSQRFEHRFLIELSDNIEERRADEFAAAVLVPTIEGCETIREISERFSISPRLAKAAVQLYRSIEATHPQQ